MAKQFAVSTSSSGTKLHDDAEAAIRREKQIKKWNRAWKVRLIEEGNPYWNDLVDGIVK